MREIITARACSLFLFLLRCFPAGPCARARRLSFLLFLCGAAACPPLWGAYAAHHALRAQSVPDTLIQRALVLGPLVHPLYPPMQSFKEQYRSARYREYLSVVMQRSAPYRPFIEKLLRDAHLPVELLFLPVVESGFLERAVSKSGAVGIWQFMRNSIAGSAMRVSDWVDERRDPWKASVAAVKKLQWNYTQLRDWPLALAAYNCGLGAIKRAIAQAGTADFWHLSERGFLRDETVRYVPKFLAVAEVLSRSHEHGIAWGAAHTPEETTTVTVSRAVDLNLLAQAAGMDAQLLHTLNPALRYSITPPNAAYTLRVPSTHAQAVQAVLNRPGAVLVHHTLHTIRSGDTLYALARRYGLGVDTLKAHNRAHSATHLKIGQKLIIPTIRTGQTRRAPLRGAGTRAPGVMDQKEHAVPEVSALPSSSMTPPTPGGADTRAGADAPAPPSVPPPPESTAARATPAAPFVGKHVVQQRDTLWSLAKRYGVSVENLAEENNLAVDATLSLGMILKTPRR